MRCPCVGRGWISSPTGLPVAVVCSSGTPLSSCCLVRGSSAFVRLPHSAHLGGGAQTFSFNSSLINPPGIPTAAQINMTGGNVGSNGNISIGGNTTAIHGSTSSAIGGSGTATRVRVLRSAAAPTTERPTTFPYRTFRFPRRHFPTDDQPVSNYSMLSRSTGSTMKSNPLIVR
jgi:hypothetical protein